MYQALYRKWRPSTFDEVVGQQHITETLKNQVRTGRLSHAYLFIGTRGTGKTTCARILAKAVNCEHPVDGNPCGHCAACRGIADGSVLDVVELDAASNNGVDNVRALREEAVFSPASVKKRVYIIDEVHMLSTAAFNALLKILEEPPEHLMFILATTELQMMPATILSRCQRHSFKRIDPDTIADYLLKVATQEHMELQRDAAQLIARLAEGGMRDALSLLDQCSAAEKIDLDAVYNAMGLSGNRRTAAMLDQILRGDCDKALQEFNSMWINGKDPGSFIGELVGLMRDVLMVKVAPQGAKSLLSGAYDMETLISLGKLATTDELIYALETAQKTMGDMRYAKNPRTVAELCIVTLCAKDAGESVGALKARISRLEEKLKNGVTVAAAPQTVPAQPIPEPEETDEERELFSSGDVEAEYEELDAEQFAEEQPEDSLPPIAAEQEPPESRPEPVAEDGAALWKRICAASAPKLDVGTRLTVTDPEKVFGVMEGDTLHVYAEAGFIMGRVKRPEIVKALSEAASEVTGKAVSVMVSELVKKQESGQKRSLDELRKFKEVRFVE